MVLAAQTDDNSFECRYRKCERFPAEAVWVLASYSNVEGHTSSLIPMLIYSSPRQKKNNINNFLPQKWLELQPWCSFTSPRSWYSSLSDDVSVQWLDLALGCRCRVGAEVPFHHLDCWGGSPHESHLFSFSFPALLLFIMQFYLLSLLYISCIF